SSAVVTLPRSMWGISRAALDHVLLEHARAAGASVEQPARCESIDGSTVVIRDLVTNRTRRIDADKVLLADGKAGRAGRTFDLGVKAHVQGVCEDAETISLFSLNGHYVGLAAVEGQRWNLCMSVPASRVRAFSGDLDAVFNQCMSENLGLKERMQSAHRVSDWLASPLP